MPGKRSFPRTQGVLLAVQLIGGLVVCFLGLIAGYWLRFHTALRHVGVDGNTPPTFRTYLPLLILGALFMVASFAYLGLYNVRLMLRPKASLALIVRGITFWFLIFLSTSLILKFEPAISRIFVAISCLTALLAISAWRFLFFTIVSKSRLRQRIVQRVVIIGWNRDAEILALAIAHDRNHPYEFEGIVRTSLSIETIPVGTTVLGSLNELDSIIQQLLIDTVIVADFDLPREQMLGIANLCECRYVDFRIIPSVFQVFVSNLKMITISGVPILGLDILPVRRFSFRIVKRSLDIVGGIVGLVLSAPIIALLALLIRRESPGSIIYRQVRSGRHGRPFTIYKLRSMRTDAEATSGAQWAEANDPRRLRIGAFMREWNLDELPQFWNVLKGDMSLVGPRPERPELIAKFEKEIPHYNPRHAVRPGITGWAQVNGLRGNTSLTERIRYDLHYIENWSVYLDIQIMVLTFFRRNNAY